LHSTTNIKIIEARRMGGACSMHKGMCTKLRSAPFNGEKHLKGLGVGGDNIKTDLKEAGWQSVVWTFGFH
jgi:hypothetical protein